MDNIDNIITKKTYISGPRWAGLKTFLYDASYTIGFNLKITDTDKGWIRETIYFEISGTPRQIKIFDDLVKKTINNYNKE